MREFPEPKILQQPHGYNKGAELEHCPTITANGKFEYNNLVAEPIIAALRGRNLDNPIMLDEQNNCVKTDGIVGVIMTDGSSPKHNNRVIEPCCRVRKLTPRECWRLMGWTDEQFDKAKWYTKEESEALLKEHPNHKGKRQFDLCGRIEKMSDSQLYKQAGNGIVIQVLEVIFRRMFLEEPENGVQPNTEGQMEFVF